MLLTPHRDYNGEWLIHSIVPEILAVVWTPLNDSNMIFQYVDCRIQGI